MRIAVVGPWGAPCGISVYNGDVYGELRRRGHTLFVAASEETCPTETPADIPYQRLWRAGQPPSWKLALELLRFQPDVIHVQHEIGFFSPLTVWREWLNCLQNLGVPIVVTYHSVPDVATSITDLPVTAAIVCSPIGAEILASRVNFPVFGIEHGVDGPIPAERDCEPHSLVTFGFLAECKGYERILRAMVELREELPDLTLSILGSLTPRALPGQMDYFLRLQQQVFQLGLAGRVDVSCGFRTLAEVRAVLARKALGVLHYDRTDRLQVAELREDRPSGAVAMAASASTAESSTDYGVNLRTTGHFPPPILQSFWLGTTGVRPDDPESFQPSIDTGAKAESASETANPGSAGVRCQSAAVFRTWSSGLPCIVSQAQHFDLGLPMRKALIRARGVPELVHHIRRLLTDPAAYASACQGLTASVTRTWSNVVDDHEQVYSAVVGSP